MPSFCELRYFGDGTAKLKAWSSSRRPDWSISHESVEKNLYSSRTVLPAEKGNVVINVIHHAIHI